jgi:primary-amine oxidase
MHKQPVRSCLLFAICLCCSSLTAQDQPATTTASQTGIDPDVGQQVNWEEWSFKWQFRDIEGLVLTDVHFGGRKVLKSLSLAEIYVPYAPGQPRPEDFALGGFKANPMPLKVGTDCIGTGTQCKAYTRDGKVAMGDTADVMIHEEPTGFMYAGSKGRAPGKMLVLWTMAHFPGPHDGYTYVIRWKLKSDGSICPDVGATGGLQHLNVGTETGRGLIVGKDEKGEKVFAPSHVHNFYFRIDFDIDGAATNIAEEFGYVLDDDEPGKAQALWLPLKTECWRVRREDIFRSWRVKNPKSKNAQGLSRSYHLIPGGNGAWKDGNYPFLQGDFFVTKYHDDEFPYTTQDRRRMLVALSNYLDEESIASTDVVVWYRLSFVHHPRSEDWPQQPIVWHSFEMMPRDFLDASPLKVEK